VVRGGSFGNDARGLRVSFRISGSPADRDDSLGFRCARDVSPCPPLSTSSVDGWRSLPSSGAPIVLAPCHLPARATGHMNPRAEGKCSMPSFSIKTYTISVTNNSTPYAWIMLFDADQGSAATYLARLNFLPMQENNSYSMSQSGNFIQVSMNYRTLDEVVDLLRNEKPLAFHWNTSNKVCIVASSEEPAGEAEP
jgi:hypothetical protein